MSLSICVLLFYILNLDIIAAPDAFGTHGDFTTAPEISQLFGEAGSVFGAFLCGSILESLPA